MTFAELCERLIHIDEVSLLELLEISSDDIVNRFEDRIEEKREYFEEDLEDEDYEY